jgi:hypothetical protein
MEELQEVQMILWKMHPRLSGPRRMRISLLLSLVTRRSRVKEVMEAVLSHLFGQLLLSI